jgi:hypothetical protein
MDEPAADFLDTIYDLWSVVLFPRCGRVSLLVLAATSRALRSAVARYVQDLRRYPTICQLGGQDPESVYTRRHCTLFSSLCWGLGSEKRIMSQATRLFEISSKARIYGNEKEPWLHIFNSEEIEKHTQWIDAEHGKLLGFLNGHVLFQRGWVQNFFESVTPSLVQWFPLREFRILYYAAASELPSSPFELHRLFVAQCHQLVTDSDVISVLASFYRAGVIPRVALQENTILTRYDYFIVIWNEEEQRMEPIHATPEMTELLLLCASIGRVGVMSHFFADTQNFPTVFYEELMDVAIASESADMVRHLLHMMNHTAETYPWTFYQYETCLRSESYASVASVMDWKKFPKTLTVHYLLNKIGVSMDFWDRLYQYCASLFRDDDVIEQVVKTLWRDDLWVDKKWDRVYRHGLSAWLLEHELITPAFFQNHFAHLCKVRHGHEGVYCCERIEECDSWAHRLLTWFANVAKFPEAQVTPDVLKTFRCVGIHYSPVLSTSGLAHLPGILLRDRRISFQDVGATDAFSEDTGDDFVFPH